jgi:hypothetical protein
MKKKYIAGWVVKIQKLLDEKRKIKVVLRTLSGKKITTLKFPKAEFKLIEKAAAYNNQTISEFFNQMLIDIVENNK